MGPLPIVRRAWFATLAFFLIHGLIVSAWVSRIPTVQQNLHLANGVLGLALLATAAGCLVTIPITGVLISRYGSRCIVGVSCIAFCCSLLLPGLATNFWTLTLSLFLFGCAAGSNDVAFNAQGVLVEHRLGSPTMSRFHAFFSLGGMAGAGIGAYAAKMEIRPLWHFAGVCVAALLLTVCSWPFLIEGDKHTHTAERPHRVALRNMPSVLFALSAIGFCILLTEGAMADWTAIYLKQVMHAATSTAAIGYAAFSGAMALFRLLGDMITTRLGSERTVRWGSFVAALGLIIAIAAPNIYLAIAGFAIVGMGVSVIVPLVFGAGGRVPGVPPGAGIATVTGLGYIGFLVGPPIIGFLSQLVTLRFAFILTLVLCFVSALLSKALTRTEPIDIEAQAELQV